MYKYIAFITIIEQVSILTELYKLNHRHLNRHHTPSYHDDSKNLF